MANRLILTVILTFCFLATGCNSSPVNNQKAYTATMEATINGITSTAKVIAGDNKYRLEVLGGRRSSIMIARYDLNTLWLLIPEDKSYVKMSIDSIKDDLPEFFREGTSIEKTLISEELVDQKPTKKYKTKVKSVRNKQFEGYLWESTEFPGYPLKWEDLTSGLVVSWKDGKLSDIPAETFELPKDYKERSIGADLPSGQ